MVNKFLVGDVIIGNKRADSAYHITRTGAICRVIDVRPKDTLVVECNGGWYSVDSKYFDLYKPAKEDEDAHDDWLEIITQ